MRSSIVPATMTPSPPADSSIAQTALPGGRVLVSSAMSGVARYASKSPFTTPARMLGISSIRWSWTSRSPKNPFSLARYKGAYPAKVTIPTSNRSRWTGALSCSGVHSRERAANSSKARTTRARDVTRWCELLRKMVGRVRIAMVKRAKSRPLNARLVSPCDDNYPMGDPFVLASSGSEVAIRGSRRARLLGHLWSSGSFLGIVMTRERVRLNARKVDADLSPQRGWDRRTAREAFGMRGERLIEHLLSGGVEPRRLAGVHGRGRHVADPGVAMGVVVKVIQFSPVVVIENSPPSVQGLSFFLGSITDCWRCGGLWARAREVGSLWPQAPKL